jgi:hypothetical protein
MALAVPAKGFDIPPIQKPPAAAADVRRLEMSAPHKLPDALGSHAEDSRRVGHRD